MKLALRKKLFFNAWLVFLLLPATIADVYAKNPARFPYTLETRYTILHYVSQEDLEKFDGKINYSPTPWSFKKWFSPTRSVTLMDELGKKVDALYERVQDILDMRKPMEKVAINLFQNEKQLHSAFHEIYNKPCPLRAWYSYEHNGIYLNVEDVHEGMLAHEIARSIIDHYLMARPPVATAEILARYVCAHL